MGTIFCNAGPTIFHPKPQQVPYNNPMANMFCGNIPFTPNNFTLVLNQGTNLTFHIVVNPLFAIKPSIHVNLVAHFA
jgi:hypothetical protein